MSASEPEYTSLAAQASKYGVHPMTLRRLIATGDLPAVRIGRAIRVRPEDVEKLVSPIPAANPR